MASDDDVVWLDVLPSMKGFGPALTKGAGAEVDKAGDNFGTRLGGRMKIALVAGGAAVGAALVKGIGDNIDIGRINDKLAAQLGLSAQESAKAGKVAGNLYRDAYGDSMDEVSDAVGAVMSGIKGMSDASAKDLEGVTGTALNFAKTFDTDITRSVQIAGQMISTGLAKNATDAFDLMTAASQRVPASVREDLADATDEYGQFFATLGFNGKEAMGVLVEGAAKGMYGIDKAGDAIKEFTIRSTDMSTTSVAAYKAIGLDAHTMANDILAGGDTAKGAFDKIVQGILAIDDPAKRSNTAIALFGTQMEDLGVKDVPKFLQGLVSGTKSMDGFEGSAKKMGDTLNDNFATKMEGWKRTAAGFAQDGVLAIAGAIGTAVGVGRDFTGFLKENETTTKVVAGIITTLLLPAIVALGVQTAISTAQQIAGWIQMGVEAVMSAGMQITSLSLITLGWIRAGIQATIGAAKQVAAWVMSKLGVAGTILLYGVAFAMMAAGWVSSALAATAGAIAIAAAWLIALGPVGLVIAAIVGLTALIIANWDTVKNATVAVWNAVSGAISTAVSFVVDFVTAHWPLLLAILTGPIGLAVLFIVNHWQQIKDATSAVWDFVRDKVTGAVGALRNAVDTAMSAVGNAVSTVYDHTLKPVFDGIAHLIKDTVPDAFSTGVEAIGKAWGKVGDVAKKPVNFVIDTVYNNGLRKGFNAVANKLGLGNPLPHMDPVGGGGALPGGASVGGRMTASVGGGGRIPHSAMKHGGHGGGVGGIGDAWDAVKGAAGKVGDWTKDVAGAVAGKGWDFAKGLIMKPVNAALGHLPGSGPFTDLPKGAAKSVIDKTLDWLGSKFKGSSLDQPAVGPIGKAGSVMAKGSYSIGMPWHGYPGHNGADYPAAVGNPVHAPWAGKVTGSYDIPGHNQYNSTPYASYGRVVKIDYANGHSSLFAHLSARDVATGQSVAAGQQVGRVGMNGNATGPHLHAEFDGGSINPASLGIFDKGGWLAPGAAAMNLSNKPEPVFSASQWATLKDGVGTTGIDKSGLAEAIAEAMDGIGIGIEDNGAMADNFAGRLNTRHNRNVVR